MTSDVLENGLEKAAKKIRKKLRQIENLEALPRDLNAEELEKVRLKLI